MNIQVHETNSSACELQLKDQSYDYLMGSSQEIPTFQCECMSANKKKTLTKTRGGLGQNHGACHESVCLTIQADLFPPRNRKWECVCAGSSVGSSLLQEKWTSVCVCVRVLSLSVTMCPQTEGSGWCTCRQQTEAAARGKMQACLVGPQPQQKQTGSSWTR